MSQNKSQSNNITPDAWVSYFKMLLNIDNSKSGKYISYIENSLPVLEQIMSKDSQGGPLDENVTTEELRFILRDQ